MVKTEPIPKKAVLTMASDCKECQASCRCQYCCVGSCAGTCNGCPGNLTYIIILHMYSRNHYELLQL